MRTSKSATRTRIIETAAGLFYAHGYARVGVDAIAAGAGITKRTLYEHFSSKDDLAAAACLHAGALAMQRIEVWAQALRADPKSGIETIFQELEVWSRKPNFAGSGFSRIILELVDLPNHPVRQIAHTHKRRVEETLGEALGSLGLGRSLALILEGTMMQIVISRLCEPVDVGRALALSLVLHEKDNTRKIR